MGLVAGLSAAQDQRPLPRGAPDAVVGPPPRVHVRAHEDLDPDRLRALARPGVTLWLSTSSNTLRASTLEHLARFDVAWVELRPPLKPHDALAFRRLPGVGAWLGEGALEVAGRLPGARRLAVHVEGALDEGRVRALQRAGPSEVRWTPASPVDLLQWSLFRQLPGRKVVAAPPSTLLAVRCPERPPGEPALEVHVASLLALSSEVFPCGRGMRVIVQPGTEPWLLQSLRAREPSVELVVEVGADPRVALGAQGLLDLLELGPPR